MCAICAVFGGDEADSAKFMTGFMNLRHRGPDAFRIESTSITTPGLLGYHRLEVNESLNEEAMQPLKYGQISLICNGDIYNWKELPGYNKDTVSCDVKMIMHVYKKNGRDLKKLGSMLDGVFAFCLVDLKKRKILIGRDTFGVRPLFKISSFGFLAIASEKQGLLPFLEGHPQRKVEEFPSGTIEEYAVQPGGKAVLKSINQFVPKAQVIPVITSSEELFDAAVNKMIQLHSSKLGILFGYRRSDWVDNGLLSSIVSSKFAQKHTDIIQVFYDAKNLSSNCLYHLKRTKKDYAERFLFIDINNEEVAVDTTIDLNNIIDLDDEEFIPQLPLINADCPGLLRACKFIKQKTDVAILLVECGSNTNFEKKRDTWENIERYDRPASVNGLEIRAPYLDFFYRQSLNI